MKGVALAVVASLLASAGMAQAARSLPELQTAARGGDAEAQFQLGEAYRTGTGTAVDRDQAIMWFKRAADQGSQPARDALGMLLFTRGNRQEAMPLIEAAAARGDARALYILATARFNGDYVARDWPRAYAEMSRAAELGLPQARTSLAQMEPYLLAADRAKADQIRATMAATAPAGAPRALPPTIPPVPQRVAPASVASASRNDDALGLPVVPANGSSGTGFSLAPSPGATPRPAPPQVTETVIATAPAPVAPRPVPVAAAPSPPPRPAPRAPVAAAAASPPARGAWRVQLGAYSSRDRAEAQWRAMAGKYPALALRSRAITPVGDVFRLQAEGISGRDEATALCHDIAAGGGGCFVIAP